VTVTAGTGGTRPGLFARTWRLERAGHPDEATLHVISDAPSMHVAVCDVLLSELAGPLAAPGEGQVEA
jgi:hypothetical protein